jgi:hypothetical protein
MKPPIPPDPDVVVGALTMDAFLAVNMFIVRHLVRIYAAFDGDLVAAIVLGEVAHHNLSAYIAEAADKRRRGAHTPTRMPDRSDYLPTNAFSIAQATGIPRQTVRRKVQALVARGWIVEDARGLVVSPAPFEHFRTFNAELATDVIDTLNLVVRLSRATEPDRRR